ncbi:periplasmic DMSO/TMAO reductase YedYZ, heme-binding membrane subunit [Campylobacter pinnipediorum subsp. caledonicus]|uniref:Periplasmic DMSO/TMAO reductase YedYZ, heme-binding membrane subunit n=1 Tax=Campylobacter pinnipediorum subsp. caledonicus TaxID=1874362 RepID=A0A1S6U6T9_9BACT|nr:hypothetical protein [Campylobacter pinnipediorum]AQW85822.1 periplasmic DMSO/TMAO reductase YedYZ, heme-binding membrane subunit [Campylobacter pinnipediorum subsp. caledonicus]AQW87433.1 periplasmic DMSO/TMAO reductase YedYZ, heme-binding membrane subunit [Campylobacter pinnipediorum subsp. caledonicus]OPA70940.1 hypothetical protein BB381_08105 [Campylobacter pinnipediorum subsp. caledonicus]
MKLKFITIFISSLIANAIVLTIAINMALSTADPLDKLYSYTGYIALGIIFFCIVLSKFNLHKYARALGLSSIIFIIAHLYSYIVLDKELMFLEIIRELGRNKFIWLGLISALVLIITGIFSINKFQKYRKTRRILVYLAILFGSMHVFSSAKSPGFVEYFLVTCSLGLIVLNYKKINFIYPRCLFKE